VRRRLVLPTPLLATVVLGALVGGLASCSLFDDEAASPTTASAVTTTTTPGPEVLDAGRGPRKELRLRFTEGAATTVALTLDLDVTQRAGGAEQGLDSPVVRETVRFTVGPTRGDEATVSFAFTGATVDGEGTDLTAAELAELSTEIGRLVGLGGTGTISALGSFTSFAYDLPDGLDPEVTAALEQAEQQLSALALPLPREPLGVGARWRTATRTELSGIVLDQVTTYEITELTDSGVAYTAASSQTAARQRIDPATLPAGSTAELVSADIDGATTGSLDLGSLLATTSSTLSGTQEVDLRTGDGPTQRLSQRIDVTVSVAAAG